MKTFLDTFLTPILLLTLVGMLFFKKDGPTIVPQPVITRDTVYITHSGTTPVYTPVVVTTTPAKTVPTFYLPDTTYKGVLRQYQELVDRYLATTTYRDTVRLDSVGYVALQDTVSQNRLLHRATTYSYHVPVTTVTIREPYVPRTQLYYGFTLSGPAYPLPGFNTAQLGVLLKNKRDNVLGAAAGYQLHTGVVASISYYHKLSFR